MYNELEMHLNSSQETIFENWRIVISFGIGTERPRITGISDLKITSQTWIYYRRIPCILQ